MAQSTIAEATSESYELHITRVLGAPRALVFRAWTQPEHLARWLGPKGFTAPSVQMDVRPGGAYRACIESADGTVYWMRGTYREIAPPERLVFTFAWEEDGEPGQETLVTVTLTDESGGTRLDFRQTPFRSIAERDSHMGGWSECFDRLEAYLAAA